jgi:hypothetical protein
VGGLKAWTIADTDAALSCLPESAADVPMKHCVGNFKHTSSDACPGPERCCPSPKSPEIKTGELPQGAMLGHGILLFGPC